MKRDIRFDRQAVKYYCLVTMLAVPLRIDYSEKNQLSFLLLLALGLLVAIFTGTLLYLGFILCAHAGDNVTSKIVMIFVVGAIRGVVMKLLLVNLNQADNLGHLSSIISSSLYTAIFYIGALLLSSKLHSKNLVFRNHFHQAAFYRFQKRYPQEFALNQDQFEDTLKKISKSIHSKSNLPTEDSLSDATLMNISDEIKNQINDVIRPLSHRLWINSHGIIRLRNSKDTLIDSIRNLDFSIKFVIGFQFLSNSFGISLSASPKTFFLLSYPALFSSFVLLACFNFMKCNLRISNNLKSSIVFLISLTFIPLICVVLILIYSNVQTNWTTILILAPATSILVIINSLYRLIDKDKDFEINVAKTIEYQNKSEMEGSYNENSDFILSTYLHNNLQSNLIRISKQLVNFDQTHSVSEKTSVLDELDQLLDPNYNDILESSRRNLSLIPDLILAWQGIVEISINLDKSDPLILKKERQLVDAIEEMISNAVRYGLAKSISIEILTKNNEIEVSLTHAGLGKIVKGSGLGKVTLAQIRPPELSKNDLGQTLVRVSI